MASFQAFHLSYIHAHRLCTTQKSWYSHTNLQVVPSKPTWQCMMEERKNRIGPKRHIFTDPVLSRSQKAHRFQIIAQFPKKFRNDEKWRTQQLVSCIIHHPIKTEYNYLPPNYNKPQSHSLKMSNLPKMTLLFHDPTCRSLL